MKKEMNIKNITSKKPVVIEIKDLSTEETMEIIKDYYKWLCAQKLDANDMYCFITYEEHIRTQKQMHKAH